MGSIKRESFSKPSFGQYFKYSLEYKCSFDKEFQSRKETELDSKLDKRMVESIEKYIDKEFNSRKSFSEKVYNTISSMYRWAKKYFR